MKIYIILSVFFILEQVFSTLQYIEELSKLAQFPVPVYEDSLTGHNKPFGWQRRPEGPVKEYTKALPAKEYWQSHVKDHIPLVYRGIIKDSPAVSHWTDEYLSEKYGDLDVLVEHKIEDRTSTSGRMQIKDFLKFYKTDDLYVVSMFPKEMMHEVKAVPSVMCGTFKNFTHESNLWISNGGTRSVVHYDADHNLHCMLAGRKDFMMMNNNVTTKRNLYFKGKNPAVGSGFSFLDPDKIDMEKYPNIAKVPWTWATLYAGDCIYIPSVYIHQVRAYGRSIAVTTLFTADVQNNFSAEDCTDDVMEKDWSMADIAFQWFYEKGSKTIDMGYMNIAIVKEELMETMSFFEERGKLGLNAARFYRHTSESSPLGRNKESIKDLWLNVFKFERKQVATREDFEKLSLEQWKEYARRIEAAHGVVTDGQEKVFIRPGGGERTRYEEEHKDLNLDGDEFMTEEEKRIHQFIDQNPDFAYKDGDGSIDPDQLDHIREAMKKQGVAGFENDEDDDEEEDGEDEDRGGGDGESDLEHDDDDIRTGKDEL